MRIATWNVNSVLARLPRLTGWLEEAAPDVVCLQETKVGADAFPADEVTELGYEIAAHGEGRWNGVAILSKAGLADVERGLPGDPGFPGPDTLEARTISATCGPVRVRSVYVPNGRTPEDPHYQYKLRWLAALRDAVAADAAGATPFALMGDFNVAPADDDVWDMAAFAGSTHVTPAERAALGRAARDRAERRRAADREGPAPVHLLGLPGRLVPQGHGHADRPGVRQRAVRRDGDRRVGRPGGAQGQGPQRPRPGRGRPRPVATAGRTRARPAG